MAYYKYRKPRPIYDEKPVRRDFDINLEQSVAYSECRPEPLYLNQRTSNSAMQHQYMYMNSYQMPNNLSTPYSVSDMNSPQANMLDAYSYWADSIRPPWVTQTEQLFDRVRPPWVTQTLPCHQFSDWRGKLYEVNSDPSEYYPDSQKAKKKKKKGKQSLQKDDQPPASRPTTSPKQSSLLRKHREDKIRYTLTELQDHLLEFMKDPIGNKLILELYESAANAERTMVEEVCFDHFIFLAEHQVGYSILQKLLEYGSPRARQLVAERLVNNVLRLSMHAHGCRVIQRAFESVNLEDQIIFAKELRSHVIQCIEDQNGNHVIQKMIERMPPARIQFIVDALQGSIQRMAAHCYGCRIIQRLMEHSSPSLQLDPILAELSRNIPQLIQDQYGNYVIQHMLEHGRTDDRRLILNIVASQIWILSCHKFASNVVEKAIIVSTPDERTPLLEAIVGHPLDVNPPLFTMMRDRYGNYIVQRLLELGHESQKKVLLRRLKDQVHVLKKFTYGKHIIQAMSEKALDPDFE